MNRLLRRAATRGPVVGLIVAATALPGVADAKPATTLACGTLVTQSTKLSGNIGPCTGDGLVIAANNVKLDLGGYRIFGDPVAAASPTAAMAGVRFRNVSNSEVRNGEVSGFSVGVRIDGGGGNTVRDIYAHDNVGTAGDDGDGIAAWNSSNNTIEKNRVARNGPFSGISLVTGPYQPTTPSITMSGNKIVGNEVTDNNVQICVTQGGCRPRDPQTGVQSPTATVPFGGFTTGNQADGIRIEGPNATDSLIERNFVTGSSDNGIFVMPSCRDAMMGPGTETCAGDIGNLRTFIKNNVANHNGYGRATGSGINLFGMGAVNAIQAKFNSVVGNTTNDNYTDGIQLFSSGCGPAGANMRCAATDNVVLRNSATGNRNDGIRLMPGSNRNVVNFNSVFNNGNIGLEVQIARAAGVPIAGTGASDNSLFGNQGTGNAVWDGADDNPGCDNNDWDQNRFGTVNQPCVADNSPGGPVVTPGWSKSLDDSASRGRGRGSNS